MKRKKQEQPFYEEYQEEGETMVWYHQFYTKVVQPKQQSCNNSVSVKFYIKKNIWITIVNEMGITTLMITLTEMIASPRSGSRLGWLNSEETRISSLTNSNCLVFWIITFFHSVSAIIWTINQIQIKIKISSPSSSTNWGKN